MMEEALKKLREEQERGFGLDNLTFRNGGFGAGQVLNQRDNAFPAPDPFQINFNPRPPSDLFYFARVGRGNGRY